MGDADYLAVFHHILLPIAYEVKTVYLSINSQQNRCKETHITNTMLRRALDDK